MPEEIRFYRVGEAYGCFSNFSPHPVFLDGATWPTTEHYFQAQKFLDGERRVSIQAAGSPAIAARMGRSRSRPLRPDWEQVKDDVMRKAVRAKVIQHAQVRQILLSTGDATLIEHSNKDRYWADGGDGRGKNMLGKIWMEVRAELTRDGAYDELAARLPPPWLQYPQIPRGSIGWRMGAGESYLCEWVPWYGGLSAAGKQAYQQMYPEPKAWRGFYGQDSEG